MLVVVEHHLDGPVLEGRGSLIGVTLLDERLLGDFARVCLDEVAAVLARDSLQALTARPEVPDEPVGPIFLLDDADLVGVLVALDADGVLALPVVLRVDACTVGGVLAVVVVHPATVPLVGLLALAELQARFLAGGLEGGEILDLDVDRCDVAHVVQFPPWPWFWFTEA